MENNQQQKVGAGILTVSIVQLVFSSFALIGVLMLLAAKDTISEMTKTAPLPTSVLIITMVLLVILLLGVILILMKKKLGVYIYFIAEIINLVYSIINNGFSISVVLGLVIPVLMGIFIWQKKSLFGFVAKA